MGQRPSLVLITWEMAITSFLCILSRYSRTGPSRWITSSMSSPYYTSSQGTCSDSLTPSRVGNQLGQGFDLLWAGPNATNVPKQAIIVDNTSSDIVYSNPSQWGNPDNVQFYRRSLSNTNTAGASLSYSFNGVAIWYYCVSNNL